MTPREIVNQMYRNDAFSQWLGIECLDTQKGSCTLRMVVRKEMLNGFGLTHGGITFSLADSALAFASNSHGRHAVSIETNITHLEPVREGNILTVHAVEEKCSHRVAWYRVTITDEHDRKVAIFRGTVYRRTEVWAEDSSSE